MKRIFFIISLFLTLFSFAKKWDAVYINNLITKGEIDKVIQYYQGRYYSDNRDPQDAFKIADLYVKKKEYANAMQWYDKEKQLLNTSKANLLNYANTNRLMGEYQKALDGYLLYAANTGGTAKVDNWISQCEKLLRLSSQSANYKLDNYTYNTPNDEINVASLRTNIIYLKSTKGKGDKISYSINQIVRNYENFAEPIVAYKNNIPNLIITSLSFSRDGNTVVFSAKDEKEPSKNANIKNNEKIYIAENLAGNFLNATPLTFNEANYTFKNPSFNDDGTAIYFSSNKTGGSGGFDIWKSTLDVSKNKWSTPINLGKLVNTKFDEINPFIVQDKNENTLYFSSNRDGGFGGFDIYTTKKSYDNSWQDIELQPAPINSSDDDISIVYENDIRTSYFSSNRINGKGGFDIYRCTPFSLKIIVKVNDSTTEQPLDYALVQLFQNENKINEAISSELGNATFLISKDKSFKIKASKQGYQPVVLDANTIGKANGDSIIINALLKQDTKSNISNGVSNEISTQNYIIFTGHIVDNATNKPAINAKMRMLNYATQKIRELDIDKEGKFEIKLLLNNNYKIIFENQSAKIIDEVTTYGSDKNDVKVRDYILNGSKFKLTNNRVYKNGNLPDNIKLSADASLNTPINNVVNQPITQAKIDSLLKVISSDNDSYQKYKDATPVNTNVEQEKEAQLIVVGPKDKTIKKSTTTIKRNVDTETQMLAADITPSSKNKKVKVIKEESDSIEIKIIDFDINTDDVADNINKSEQPSNNKDSQAETNQEIKNSNIVTVPKTNITTEIAESDNAETDATKKMKAIKQAKTSIAAADDLQTAKNKTKTTKAPKVKTAITTAEDEIDETTDATKTKPTKQATTVTTIADNDLQTAKNKSTVSTTAKVKTTTTTTEDEIDETADAAKTKPTKQATTVTTIADNDLQTAKNKSTVSTTPKVKTITTTAEDEIDETADAAKTKPTKQATTVTTIADNDLQTAKNKSTVSTTPKVKTTTTTAEDEIDETADAAKTKKSTKIDVANTDDNLQFAENKTTNTLPKVNATVTTAEEESNETVRNDNDIQAETKSKKSISELKSAQNSGIVTTNDNQTINNNIKEQLPDLYYKIQLASYKENNLTFPEFSNFGKVEMVNAYDRYIYRLGNFMDLDQAKQILDKVREQGYFVAFILIYNKDKVKGVIK